MPSQDPPPSHVSLHHVSRQGSWPPSPLSGRYPLPPPRTPWKPGRRRSALPPWQYQGLALWLREIYFLRESVTDVVSWPQIIPAHKGQFVQSPDPGFVGTEDIHTGHFLDHLSSSLFLPPACMLPILDLLLKRMGRIKLALFGTVSPGVYSA